MNGVTSQFKTLLNPDREKSWNETLEDDVCSLFPSLSYTHRIVGCLSCVLVGFLLSFGSFFRFGSLLKGEPGPFVVAFTLGNIISLTGSCFLSGPVSQVKSMFEHTRVIASCMYLSSIIGTIVVAFALDGNPSQGILLVFCIILQYVAVIWYTLSYIPFARKIMTSCCKSCCEDNFA